MTLKTDQMEAFIKLFDGDEEAANKWLEENAEGRARAIADAGMVRREQGDDDNQVVTPEPATQNVNLDDSAVAAIARAIVESEGFTNLVNPLTERVAALEARMTEIGSSLETQGAEATEARKRMDARLQALEADEDAKRQTWLADLPAAKRNGGMNVTYRPRQKEQETPESMADVAAETNARSPIKY